MYPLPNLGENLFLLGQAGLEGVEQLVTRIYLLLQPPRKAVVKLKNDTIGAFRSIGNVLEEPSATSDYQTFPRISKQISLQSTRCLSLTKSRYYWVILVDLVQGQFSYQIL